MSTFNGAKIKSVFNRNRCRTRLLQRPFTSLKTNVSAHVQWNSNVAPHRFHIVFKNLHSVENSYTDFSKRDFCPPCIEKTINMNIRYVAILHKCFCVLLSEKMDAKSLNAISPKTICLIQLLPSSFNIQPSLPG